MIRSKLAAMLALAVSLVGVAAVAQKGGGLRYSSIAASSALTNSTTETTLDTFTLAADELKAGDVVHIKAGGIATATNSTDTLQLKVKIGGTVVIATAAVDVADNDIWTIDTDVVVRTDGPSGTFYANGVQQLGVEGTATMRQDHVVSSAIDTTAALAVIITGTWSVASASNSCRNDMFIVEIKRPYTQD